MISFDLFCRDDSDPSVVFLTPRSSRFLRDVFASTLHPLPPPFHFSRVKRYSRPRGGEEAVREKKRIVRNENSLTDS